MNDEMYVIKKEAYPVTLKNVKNIPKRLFVRGRLPDSPETKYLCVIGARQWTPYGLDAVNKIISEMRGYPVTIVSGLAIGIDSLAHEAALRAGLHCIAFPGSTLEWDAIYPQTRAVLAKNIVSRGGALMSQWRPGYETGNWAFPSRNRLMAGISHATLIIEAAKGSGSLMTAGYALEYGRDIFAVPGSIFMGNSYGPHMLIQNGAKIITCGKDILREFGFSVSHAQSHLDRLMKTFDEPTRKIVEIISLGNMTASDIIDRTGIPVTQVSEKLTLLELWDVISESYGTFRLK